MADHTDSQLLRTYAERKLEPAFTELVHRHVDFVYSAALRMVRDPHLAEDVTQAVFIALAKQAPDLITRATLAGWLHCTARNIAAQTVRTIERRRAREQEAAAMNELNPASPEGSWEQIEPHLDAALGELTDSDRDAVVLRYFQNKSAAEMAQILGISSEAAQKRVSRAVDKLRESFSKRKITVGAGSLAVMFSANAVQAAPLGLAATISTAAIAGSAITTSTLVAATTKITAMTALQKTIIVATVATFAGAAFHEGRQAVQLRDQVRTLQQQQSPLAEQIQKLQTTCADATNRLALLLAENSQLKSNSQQNELLKLRGAVGQLRGDAQRVNDPVVQQALRRKANVDKMRQLFREHPEQQVPELKLLSDDYFFDLARDQDLESTNGLRKAYSELRTRAANQFANQLMPVLQKFVEKNPNQRPENVLALAPLFDPPIDTDILEHYEIVDTASLAYKSAASRWPGGWMVTQKDTPDSDYDDQWFISPGGFTSAPYKKMLKKN